MTERKAIYKDLIVEMLVDLSTIYVGLLVLQLAGSWIFADGWMTIWNLMLEKIDWSDHMFYVLGNLLIILIAYWIPAIFYTLIDVYKPPLLYQYKVQEEKKQVDLDGRKIMQIVIKVLSNQVTQTLIGSEIAWRYRYQYINMDEPLDKVPSLGKMMFEISLFLIIFEVTFYHSHLLFHTKTFYKYHKSHHEWRAPIAAATAQGHFLDFMMHCALAVALGPILVRSHLSTAWVWYGVIMLHELNDHSGYHFPFFRSSQVWST